MCFLWVQNVISGHILAHLLVKSGEPPDSAEDKMLRHVAGVLGGWRRAAQRLRHGADVVGAVAAAEAQVTDAQVSCSRGKARELLPRTGPSV